MTIGKLSVGQFLEAIASREPAPGGGAVAGVTVAAAAGLVAMAARFSDALEDGLTVAERADQLRAQASRLAEEDGRAYGAVLEAYRLPKDADIRAVRIRETLAAAADVPLDVVACAVQVGELAARLAAEGNPNLQGDAVTAALLAHASARSAAHLVALNVALGQLDGDRVVKARAWCEALEATAGRAEAAVTNAQRSRIHRAREAVTTDPRGSGNNDVGRNHDAYLEDDFRR